MMLRSGIHKRRLFDSELQRRTSLEDSARKLQLQGSGSGCSDSVPASEAVLMLQAVWRGHLDRVECAKRKGRSKPFGYYTHTLGLSYIPEVRTSRQVSWGQWLFDVFDEPNSSNFAYTVSLVIIATIGLSIFGFIMETVATFYFEHMRVIEAVEVFCTAVFSVEYCCRLAVCEKGGISLVQFMLSPFNALDLLAILPFYIELVLKSAGFSNAPTLRALRVVRLIRVVRVFKLGRYAAGMRLTAKALIASSQAISVLVFLLGMGCVVFSSALYHFERMSCPLTETLSAADLISYAQECDDAYNRGWSPQFGLCCTADGSPNDFPSIIAAMWWAMVTMTSVGYGDVYPKTSQGKCLGFVVMLTGMVVIALPVAIVGQKFQDVYESHRLETAKDAAAARMAVPGEQWSLVPTSDAVEKLRNLHIKDSALATSVTKLTLCLPEVWEQREQIMRGRIGERVKSERINAKTRRLLSGVEAQGDVSTSEPET
mmetsp:Transcript_62233/g.190094  ORF Transcript_62233/g.190094 Transcript_62233/m.190094 type:complete len:485 (-) Transcript_62233:187-1641(-)